MGYSQREKAATHERIVRVAAKRFRELGLDGIGVADVMKEAGVTVGGFYKHFQSRDELVVEALATAFHDLDRWEEHADTLTALLESYLSEAHRDAPGTGCALGAFVGDMSRASRSARAVYTARLKRSLAFASGLVPADGTADQRGRAILMISAMLGAINLSRAVSDPKLSREVLTQTRDQLARFCQTADPPSDGATPRAPRRKGRSARRSA
jgi:TetR/AcrR family transcriptional regulator, transcriptional repressor for nem operon